MNPLCIVIFFLLWTLARYPYATEQEALSLILDEAYKKFNDYYYYYFLFGLKNYIFGTNCDPDWVILMVFSIK